MLGLNPEIFQEADMTNFPKTAAACAAALFLAGCAHVPGGIAASNTPLEGKTYDVLGEVKGTKSRTQLLGLIPISGPNTIQAAIDDAKSKMDADALIDVTADAYSDYWILWSNNTTVVRGKAIKFK